MSDLRPEPGTDLPDSVASEILRTSSVRLIVERRFDAGEYGAWAVRDAADGREGVLKLESQAPDPHAMATRQRRIETLRGRGYPAARYWIWGELGDGRGFTVQERLPGRAMRPLTASHITALIALNRLQEDVETLAQSEWTWSSHVLAALTRDALGWWRRLDSRGGPGLGDVTARARTLVARHGGAVLPATDLVHGDFTPGNVLGVDGRVTGVIDLELLGPGPRTHDLGVLLHEWFLERHEQDPACAPDGGDLLAQEILAAGGRPALVQGLVMRTLGMLVWDDDGHRGPPASAIAVAADIIDRTFAWLDQ